MYAKVTHYISKKSTETLVKVGCQQKHIQANNVEKVSAHVNVLLNQR